MSIKTSLKSAFPFLNGITTKPALYREKFKYLGSPKQSGDAFNSWMAEQVKKEEPTCVCRLGSVELSALRHYIEYEGYSKDNDSVGVLNNLFNNAGVYPNEPTSFNAFAKTYLNDLPLADLVGIWYNPGERATLEQYAPCAHFTELQNLEPYYFNQSWLNSAKGKRFLIITPFIKTARSQVAQLKAIWPQYKGLFHEAAFEFIKAPAHAAMVTPSHLNWSTALDALKAQMDTIDYDVLIVGAGAWGLPLAVHAKRTGKIGYHLGGSTQLLFGIKGKRWDTHPIISKLYNDHWVRPYESEIPKKANLVEEGCYW
ncbi:hypothetical protein SH580_06550 [Coraliomargarita algicola]|uniref:Glycosyltransferase GT-D fold domain-containing protein n=1 Tax=Coraliomargarita algicola TaxID=3092156 RepID=A0ABZ0RMN0_9BACT|nr:hypothetical protein [Coraliomargarita sp. J2-16]WPJ97367.1 hypothetical protein SH580_06550 [Coraliomargarita sp. J2-16]